MQIISKSDAISDKYGILFRKLRMLRWRILTHELEFSICPGFGWMSIQESKMINSASLEGEYPKYASRKHIQVLAIEM